MALIGNGPDLNQSNKVFFRFVKQKLIFCAYKTSNQLVVEF